jgi:hypothetical protein
MDLKQFVDLLDASEDPVATATDSFARLRGVERELGNVVAATDERRHLSRVQACRVPNVEPMVWPLISRAGHYDVVLNAYDPVRFERLRLNGYISPHRHTFSFASVVLNGGFAHFTFDNDGELEKPSLRPQSQEYIARHGQLLLNWRDYHCVLAPRPLTATLMVRSTPVAQNPFLGDEDYCISQLSSDRAMLLDALSQATAPATTG